MTRRFFLPALFACLFAAPAGALDGGRAVSTGDAIARSTVAVQAVLPDGEGRARFSECTGALIAPDLVLTAAHCVDIATGPDRVAVFLYDGAKAVAPPLSVRAIRRHPGHKKGWAARTATIENRQAEIASDIAILHLASPAPRPPLALGGARSELTLFAAGQAGPEGAAGTLRKVALGNLSPTKTSPSLVFATPSKARICRGDSGGPIVDREGRIFAIAGAVLRPKEGCAARLVAVPVDPASPALRSMLGSARGG